MERGTAGVPVLFSGTMAVFRFYLTVGRVDLKMLLSLFFYTNMDIKTMLEKFKKIFAPKGNNQFTNNGWIILIEDNVSDRNFFSQVLLREDYKLTAVTSENFAGIEKDPNVSLIIIGSTGGKSLDLCAKLKTSERTKCIPILIIAEKDDPWNIMEYYSQKVDLYLRKPITRKELITQARALIDSKTI